MVTRALTISPTPFRSSRLALPPSPFSPRLPLTPPADRHTHASTRDPAAAESNSAPALLPPPTTPLHWLWQCHLCRRTYKLGVTRRCLDDGHNFCAGTTAVRSRHGAKVRRHRACASEFDYQGWSTWGEWRRAVQALRAADDASAFAVKSVKDCWDGCDYPSQCRWGAQFGVVATQKPVVVLETVAPPPATDFKDIITPEQDGGAWEDAELQMQKDVEREDSMEVLASLVVSATNRKRKSLTLCPSPLSSHPVDVAVAAGEDALMMEGGPVLAPSGLSKVLDEFHADVRESLGKANEYVTSVVGTFRGSAALEEERIEGFVKGLRLGKKKLGAGKK